VEQVVVPLAVVVGIVLLLVAAAAGFTARRIALARRGASFDCSLRRADGRWTLGIARYGNDRIDWFRAFWYSWRPQCTWLRDDLAVLGRRVPQGSETTAVLPHAVVIHCRHRSDELDLAMSDDAYTGFASWIESSPPGRHANVT
jgi:hypothetical protein